MSIEQIEFTRHALERAKQFGMPDRETLELMFLQGQEERNSGARVRKNVGKYGPRGQYVSYRYCLLPESDKDGVLFTYSIKPAKKVVITVYPMRRKEVRIQY